MPAPVLTPMPATADPGTPAPASKQLLALHREGRLAAEFPRVCTLLADLPAPDLRRAGQLLRHLDPDEVRRHHPDIPVVTVAVTGHGTLAPLLPALAAELGRHGLLLRPSVSTFDSYVFELSDPDSALYRADPDIACCVLDPMVVFDELPTPWRPSDVEGVLAQKVGLLARLADRFGGTGRGTLVLNTLPLPHRCSAQLIDYRSRAELGAVWREANARLLRLTAEHASVVVLDLEPLLADGVAASDPRLSRYAKAHLSPDLLAGYAREVGHLARHLTGRTKKCLVLDLDGTVWGGLVGEDGVDGIELGEGYRGEAFHAFQRVAKQLGSQGVLLAAVSKNDMEPVRQALREHPGMALREQDFVRVTANWRAKHDNLGELAADLNLGVDSFVFADDSPYECGLVRRELPCVAVLQLDDEPVLHIETLLRDGWFDTHQLTADDQVRPARYRDEAARADFLRGSDSIGDYLRELEIRVRLDPVGEPQVARVSQLTLRTNQFNLTARRLQPPQVRALAVDPAGLVLAIHAEDRFGDNGLVGALVARRDRDVLHIDDFVLSCRVFSRGIEQACLAALLRHARATGAGAVLGAYRRTDRNSVVADLYRSQGFRPAADDGTTATFRHDLLEIAPPPPHIQLTGSIEGRS